MSRQLGIEPMPWQRYAWDIGTEYELGPDGKIIPAYRETICTVMRQSGKSLLTFVLAGHRCTVWQPQPQRVIYSAQDGQAAVEKLMEDMHPLFWGSSAFRRLLLDDRNNRGLVKSNGKERIRFRTGSFVRYIGSAEDAGHGLTSTGLAIIDESFSDIDDRREQALSPSMATVADAQTWNVSTAGTEASVFLRRKIETGRMAAESGSTRGICYIEYSIPDDADIDDPETWWAHMPALGWTITEDVVALERRRMSDGDFRRAFGNQWTVTDERVIPLSVWESVQTDEAPSGDLRFAVEVDPQRESAWVVVTGDNDVAELVEFRQGVGWVEDELPDRVVELCGSHGGTVRLDASGPAGYLLPRLESAGVRVEKFGAREVVQACVAFYDGLADRRFRVRVDPSGRLDAAAAAVHKRRVGESWAWSRHGLGAGVMALSLSTYRDRGPSEFFVY